MASYAGKVETGSDTSPIGSTLFGTCTTPAATAAKVVELSNFDTLINGVTIHVKFTNGNTAASPTLNVNSTGAYPIYRYNTITPGTSASESWAANSVVSLTYDVGTSGSECWRMNDAGANQAIMDTLRNEIASSESATKAVIAPAYDATATYSLGDLVIYNGYLYKCISAISTAEAWTAAHWLQTKVSLECVPRKGTISMPTADWVGSGPWTQTVTVTGATVYKNSMVSLQPDATVYTQMATDGTAAIFVENNDGTLTAKAIQKKPTANITVQCTVTETI